MNSKISLTIALFALAGLAAFKVKEQPAPAPWPVPDKYVKMANPVKPDAKSIAAGKTLFAKYCQDCHGKKGIGDGIKAPEIKTPVQNLTKPSIQGQSDGALFYKITEGRKDMPRAKKDLPDDFDRWNLVNFLRTLMKK
jgi:mono/diheme cytochrome c family protein